MGLSVIIKLLSPHIIPVVVSELVWGSATSAGSSLVPGADVKKERSPPPTSNSLTILVVHIHTCRHTHTIPLRLLPSPWHLIRPTAQRLPDVSVLLASFDYILSNPLAGLLTGWLDGGLGGLGGGQCGL